MLDFKKQERSKEVAALEAAKQERQTDLIEMQEQLETAQTAVDAAEQRMQKVEQTYQKQSQKLNKLAPIMEGLENLSAQYSQRPEEWVPEAATFETAKSYREKKAMPLIQKLVKVCLLYTSLRIWVISTVLFPSTGWSTRSASA